MFETLEPERKPRPTYWLTRFLILRLLGLVYTVAFLVAAMQVLPLIGSDGLTPASLYLDQGAAAAGSRLAAFLQEPSLFWMGASDHVLLAAAWIGTVLSLVVLLGYANAILMLVLWALYMSFVHIGQIWYGYGWEIQLLETGFLAIFLCPLLDGRPFPRRAPPVAVIWLYRWLIFRIMLGAGLIKLRGDTCWRDLTCLFYHYETQPIPNPLSRTFHFLPHWMNRCGVLFNHLAELIAPWGAFGPRLVRYVAGAIMLTFQITLILSGNLSFLNYLTIVPILACFDDALLRRLLPRRLVARAERATEEAQTSAAMTYASWALAALVAALSIYPVMNLLSPHQAMNTAFERLELVNTYGAFGSVGQQRNEIIFEGTKDEPGAKAEWRPYEFKCKPGDIHRRPCILSPYHLRIDWQIWFAAMSTPNQYPWTIHFVWKLLHNDPGTLSLLDGNPFPEGPPRYVRALLYQYEYAPPGNSEGDWWHRRLLGTWIPPLSVDDPRLRRFLKAYGWLEGEPEKPNAP
ncbi:MAG TPA: lipase maturation factor family protein [Candidatus Saccharimonadales bacterium]|nr:lipase maturation factor family protein [Candidatus Saccharimonadales bacterium]